MTLVSGAGLAIRQVRRSVPFWSGVGRPFESLCYKNDPKKTLLWTSPHFLKTPILACALGTKKQTPNRNLPNPWVGVRIPSYREETGACLPEGS